MKNRILVALLCLCAVLLGGLLRPVILPAAAQSTATGPAVQAGRYGIAANSERLYFVDTQTGRLWYLAPSTVNKKGDIEMPAWQETPSPVH